ncbi:hypothetical protein [Thiolapillus sp.]|uniref:hypothetical protein n=1 Tax=Thiolapillus sp. TaxID=2017437 RepID=UPI003AF9FF74
MLSFRQRFPETGISKYTQQTDADECHPPHQQRTSVLNRLPQKSSQQHPNHQVSGNRIFQAFEEQARFFQLQHFRQITRFPGVANSIFPFHL